MTRFDAATPEERQKLFAEAITAHRERGSAFVTFEADSEDSDSSPPWIQFGDGTLNLDCTEDELDEFESLLNEFPAFKIDELTRPEESEGVNVRVSALADPNRIAQGVERTFRSVYDRPEDFRAWVTDL